MIIVAFDDDRTLTRPGSKDAGTSQAVITADPCGGMRDDVHTMDGDRLVDYARVSPLSQARRSTQQQPGDACRVTGEYK